MARIARAAGPRSNDRRSISDTLLRTGLGRSAFPPAKSARIAPRREAFSRARGPVRGAADRMAGVYAVILAGGGGTRLWPLSRPETPKPFLPLLGERTLLQRTVDRIVGHRELGLNADDVAVVTERRYGPMVRAQLPGVRVIAEPI